MANDFLTGRPERSLKETAQNAAPDVVRESALRNILKITRTIKAFLYFALNLKSGEISQLTPQEKEILAHAANVTFPEGHSSLPSGTEAGIVEYMEQYFQRLPPHTRRLLHLLFHYIELSPLVFGPDRTLFTLSRPEDQKEILDYTTKSKYFHRMSLQAMRVLMTFGYMANEKVTKEIGCVPNTNPFGME